MIGQRNSYYLHLSVIYFSSVRLKMAARDGDRPVWPAKHCPLQIPLFIHKLDPLGLRGRVVGSVDMCNVCVGGGGERIHVERFVMNLG